MPKLPKPLEPLCVRVGVRANCHPATVRRYLLGRCNPTPHVLNAIRQALSDCGVSDPRPELESRCYLPELRA